MSITQNNRVYKDLVKYFKLKVLLNLRVTDLVLLVLRLLRENTQKVVGSIKPVEL